LVNCPSDESALEAVSANEDDAGLLSGLDRNDDDQDSESVGDDDGVVDGVESVLDRGGVGTRPSDNSDKDGDAKSKDE
jgi:hypothetical protein